MSVHLEYIVVPYLSGINVHKSLERKSRADRSPKVGTHPLKPKHLLHWKIGYMFTVILYNIHVWYNLYIFIIFQYIPLYPTLYPIILWLNSYFSSVFESAGCPAFLPVEPPIVAGNASQKAKKKTSLESLSHVICCFNPSSSHSSSFNQPPMSSPQIPCHLHHRRATMLLVTDVPILAPMIMGIAWVTESTSAPTKPTTMLVLVEELWTKTVAKMPTMRPALERLNIKRQI